MIHWLRSRWYARLRKLDKQILWPTLRAQCSAHAARLAFMQHTLHEPCWLYLTPEELERELAEMEQSQCDTSA